MRTKILVLIAFIPLIYFYLTLNQMPDQVVVHWNINGDADRYGSKLFYAGIAQLPVLILVFEAYYNKYSNRKNSKYESKIISFLVFFFSVISIVFINQSSSEHLELMKVLIFLFGAMFIYTGNIFNKLEQNRTFGIRLPATLRNEIVWNRIHYLGGYIFVCIGIITILLGIFIANPMYSLITMIVMLLTSTIFLTVYSEYLDRKS